MSIKIHWEDLSRTKKGIIWAFQIMWSFMRPLAKCTHRKDKILGINATMSQLNRISLRQKSFDCTSLHCSEVREKHTKCLFFLVTSRFTLKGSNFLSPGRKKEIASRGCWEKEGGRGEQVTLNIDNISRCKLLCSRDHKYRIVLLFVVVQGIEGSWRSKEKNGNQRKSGQVIKLQYCAVSSFFMNSSNNTYFSFTERLEQYREKEEWDGRW